MDWTDKLVQFIERLKTMPLVKLGTDNMGFGEGSGKGINLSPQKFFDCLLMQTADRVSAMHVRLSCAGILLTYRKTTSSAVAEKPGDASCLSASIVQSL